MTTIVKSLPTYIAHGRIDEFLAARFVRFYFTLGIGKPKDAPDRLFLVYDGVLLGWFDIDEILRNEGQLPKLTTEAPALGTELGFAELQ